MKSTFTLFGDYKTLDNMVDSMKYISEQMVDYINDQGVISVEVIK